MPEVRLEGKLVKDVSRSFFLTLKFLPKAVRFEISLAYLLARASDTIADTESISLNERLAYLDAYADSIAEGQLTTEFEKLNDLALPHFTDEGEKTLMSSLDEIIEAYSSLGKSEKELTKTVVEIIISGQRWDLTYFSDEKNIQSVDSAEETMSYAYKVAGCVGEYWTEMLLLKGLVSSEYQDELLSKGKSYGLALQLINILRDVEKDRLKGRCYLPVESPEGSELECLHKEWIRQASILLKEGLAYTELMPRGRAKFATLLPALIGEKTLELLEASSWEQVKAGVKVNRRVIKNSLLKGVWRSIK